MSSMGASLVSQQVKNLPAMQETGSIHGLGRSPGEGNSYPLQYSCLENSMDFVDHDLAKSQTRLSEISLSLSLSCVKYKVRNLKH